MDIRIVDYNSNWPRMFASEAAELERFLKPVLVKLHHIGSTSVPGLAAKPIIDMLLEVTDLQALDPLNAHFIAMGYEPMGEMGIERRRYFRKGGDDRTHHIHAFVAGDSHVLRHLAFRDYLRKHPEVCAEYEVIKREAAAVCSGTMQNYTDYKSEFVKRIEAIALAQPITKSL